MLTRFRVEDKDLSELAPTRVHREGDQLAFRLSSDLPDRLLKEGELSARATWTTDAMELSDVREAGGDIQRCA
jgi:hypothetical protein